MVIVKAIFHPGRPKKFQVSLPGIFWTPTVCQTPHIFFVKDPISRDSPQEWFTHWKYRLLGKTDPTLGDLGWWVCCEACKSAFTCRGFRAQAGTPALNWAWVPLTKQPMFPGGNSSPEVTHQWTLTFLLWETDQSPASKVCAALRSTINIRKWK